MEKDHTKPIQKLMIDFRLKRETSSRWGRYVDETGGMGMRRTESSLKVGRPIVQPCYCYK